MSDIDHTHELLSALEDAIIEIEETPGDPLDAAKLPLLSSIVSDLGDFGRTGFIEGLNISPTILGRFAKFRGKVSRRDALIVAERVRSYLRSQDQTFSASNTITVPAPHRSPPAIAFSASKWVLVQGGSDVKQKISAIATLLDSIIKQTNGSNLPLEEQPLTAIERAQLVSILETALAVLRSPIVEVGLMKKAREVLEKGAADAMQRGLQDGVSFMMSTAAHRLVDLLKLMGLS